jgi:hypothetical protein
LKTIEWLNSFSNHYLFNIHTIKYSFQLLSAIKTLEFQVSIHVLHLVHALTLSFNRVLQTENQDLVEAVKLADAAQNTNLSKEDNILQITSTKLL